MSAPRIVAALSVAPVIAIFVACSSNSAPPAAGVAASASVAAPAAPPAVAPRGASSASPAASASAAPGLELREEDFVESDRSRDPFRSYAKVFSEQGKQRVQSQRKVLLDKYAIDELKLVGLVTRTDNPRAMLIDPSGRGWIVTKGQFIGRAEIVHASGQNGADYEVNWRIDRVRESDIVLIREDAAHADLPTATRVIALRSDATEALVPLGGTQ